MHIISKYKLTSFCHVFLSYTFVILYRQATSVRKAGVLKRSLHSRKPFDYAVFQNPTQKHVYFITSPQRAAAQPSL